MIDFYPFIRRSIVILYYSLVDQEEERSMVLRHFFHLCSCARLLWFERIKRTTIYVKPVIKKNYS